jgi:hypothetical protein
VNNHTDFLAGQEFGNHHVLTDYYARQELLIHRFCRERKENRTFNSHEFISGFTSVTADTYCERSTSFWFVVKKSVYGRFNTTIMFTGTQIAIDVQKDFTSMAAAISCGQRYTKRVA